MNNFGVHILINWRGVQTEKRGGTVLRKLPMIGFLAMFIASLSAMASSTPSVTISWPSGSAGTGSITLTVGTYSSTVRYGVYSSAASIASNFGGSISLDPASPVWAKGYSDGTIRMRAKSATDPGAVSVCIIPDGSSGCSQPSGTSVQTNPVLPGGPTLNSGALYGYVIQKSDGSSGYDNDGNVVGYNDTVNKQWSANYDSVNRLVSAQKWSTTTPFADPWGSVMQQFFCWKYDAVGNMTYSSTSPSSYDNSCNPNNPGQTVTSIPPVDSNNRLNGSGFASSDGGNLTSDNNATYQYDGAGRLCAVQPHVTGIVTAYLYNADGQRVASGTVNQYSNWCDFTSNSFVLNKRNVLGLDGAALTQFDNMGNSTSYVSLPGDVTATLTEIAGGSNATIYYTMHDWLGTKRLEADANGNIAETCASGAFGESLSCSGTEISDKHFTGKERDTESGLDYFGARYYASTMGRFTSPDDSSGQNALTPQSWNLYSYVQNNPVSKVDPDGHDCIYADGNGGGFVKSGDCFSDSDNGHFVNGTVDATSFKYNASTNSSSFRYTPDGAGPGTIGTGTIQGRDLNGGFEPGSLGAATFGSQTASIWNNSYGVVKTAGEIEMAALSLAMPEVLAADAAPVALTLARISGRVRTAAELIRDHAYDKHVTQRGEFGPISRSQFQNMVEDTMSNPTKVRQLGNGRTAYWSDKEQMVVIENSAAPDRSTAFRPTNGKAYFDNLM